MFRQSFFDRLTTLDILQNLELLLWGKNPPHLPYLSLLFHVVPFPPWNDSLSYPISVSLVKKQVMAESTPLPEKTLYPKEKELLRICTEAKRDKRKAVVYCVHTETRDITERLKKILGDAGLQAVVLKAAKVKAGEREEWIQSFRGDVLITHPRNVQTGLDLIQFPEVVWYQQDYSVYIVRQASRRSWRIGQKEPVNV